MRSRTSWMLAFASTAMVTLALAPPARAQDYDLADHLYVAADLGVSGPIDDTSRDLYDVGGNGRLTLFGSLVPELSIGAFAEGGALSQDNVPANTIDHGIMDYGLFGASVRVYPMASLWPDRSAAGLYIGASPGIGVVNGTARLAYSGDVGFNFPIGPISIGPQFRFTQFIDTGSNGAPSNDLFANTDVLTWTAGVELTVFDQISRPAEVETTAYAPPPPSARVGAEKPVAEVPEVELEQPEEEEQVNPALVIDQRAYFDFDEADLRADAIPELDRVVEHYRQYGDRIDHLIVSGHADDFGTEEYNDMLSAARAVAVTNYLVAHGVPVEKIEVRAHGEDDPAVANATTPLQHQINRRVEFDVDWAEGQQPEGVAPEPSPNPPKYVDAIPPEAMRRNDDPQYAEREQRAIQEGRSRANQLLEQQELALRSTVGGNVAIAMGERNGDEGRTVAITGVPGTAGAAVAVR